MLTPSERVGWYRTMLLIRRFDERVMELFGEGVISGTAHACCGQEASAAGVCAALGVQDQVSSTHRGHGHLLAKGGSARLLMAELFGKATGYSHGRGGSQHVAAYDVGFLGSNGITAGGLPIATGAALAIQYLRLPHVVAAFFGEGATGQGAFHEAVNMGAAWKLPIVYVCENNLYAMGTSIDRVSPVPNMADRAAGYGIPGICVNGNDFDAVHEAAAEAVARARAGGGPSILEAKTYRIFGHSKGDAERPYRTKDEEAEWARRDPLLLFRDRLRDAGALTEAADARLIEAVHADIEDAVTFAKESPEPEPSTAADGVFAD